MFYKIVRALFAGIFRLIYRIRVVGVENIPAEGACVIAPNHTSAIDPIIIGVISKRQVRFIAKAELFVPPLSWILYALGAFPVHRAESDLAAIKKTLAVLNEGQLLCVFPQGTRCAGETTRATADRIKAGVGMMAMRTGAKVVPVYIKTKNYKLRAFHKTEVIFGTVIEPEELAAFDGRTKYMDASSFIFERICRMAESSEL